MKRFRMLKLAYQVDYDHFLGYYEAESCSCHINPPCGRCEHPGNPDNLKETEDAWELVPYSPNWERSTSQQIIDDAYEIGLTYEEVK